MVHRILALLEALCSNFFEQANAIQAGSVTLGGRWASRHEDPHRGKLLQFSYTPAASDVLFWRASSAEDLHEIRRDHRRLRSGWQPARSSARRFGWYVALIEEKGPGWHVHQRWLHAHQNDGPSRAGRFTTRETPRGGVSTPANVSVDLAKIVAQKDEIVLSFRGGQQKQVDKPPQASSPSRPRPFCWRASTQDWR